MAGSDDWDAEKMFELYLHDYLMKRKMHKTAAIFRNEANLGETHVDVVSPEGFLHEWWSMFYDVYASRQLGSQPAKEGGPVKMRIPSTIPQAAMNRHRPGQLPEDCLRRLAETFNPNLGPLDLNKPSFPMSAAVGSSHPQQQTHKRAQIQDISMEETTTTDPILYGTPEAELSIGSSYDAGFTFEEVITLQCSNGLSCCHFSSDGELLATAGNIRKVLIWDMETYGSVSTSEGHTHLITDLRFRPSSTLFATSSLDKTVTIWDAARPNKPLYKFLGHVQQVMSLDFHPQKLDLLCSCDQDNEIRLWNIKNYSCTRVSKGATKQVRFQPQFGKILATVERNIINLIDVETDSVQFYLKGHVKDILSICWDASGKYIASVSEDSARVWSAMSGGKCIHERLSSNGKKFQSCTFHPGYSQLLIIGGDQSLELWDPTENTKTCSVPAHDGLIAALADSPQTGMVASACHDDCVKLWK
ncbi:hypothetical protein F2P56_009716 [Juglans regia]|uniref:Transcriptional corepressor LEUNIG-like n=2 Tax=Juglans regia TaxID=51240 RepID=A0A834D274_JUGRE|nr:transcriptional corepressor LEUNIG-like [Juglans regia]KAF5473073.1 hypothetical protein F2P56_009716 [Juglans regia]